MPSPPEPAASLVLSIVAPGASKPAHRRRRSPLVPAGVTAAAVLLVSAVALAAIFGHSAGHQLPVAGPVPTPTTVAPCRAGVQRQPGARYNLLGSVNIDLVPSSPCWVKTRSGNATGPPVYQVLPRPGDPQTVPAAGPVWLRLGNPPAVAIVVIGTPLQTPAHTMSQRYILTFERPTTG